MNANKQYCAVYTRKSTEEGLEQSFNSLHAQREACEAYIASQRHEGWSLVPTAYDDGGISGGTMDRPGLKRLLEDIESQKVHVVVVYKVDRLTRSLPDFARMIETFDAHEVSFVSVTQQFNTTSSMGRLTLNVLLSFAQFEREVTGERIRDKIAASKKKGIWMGGPVPFGYDLGDRELLVNKQEAETVRTIFQLYADLGSVRKVMDEVGRRGFATRVRVMTSGRKIGGTPFGRSHLYGLLRNCIYVGRIGHKEVTYEGRHAAIISDDMWEKVQKILSQNRSAVANGLHGKIPSLLIGRLYDDRGNFMSPTHSTRKGKHFRYYVSQAILQNRKDEVGSLPRLPAHDIEKVVSDETRNLLGSPEQLFDLFAGDDGPTPEHKGRAISNGATLSAGWKGISPGERANLIRVILMRVTAAQNNLEIAVSRSRLRNVIERAGKDIEAPMVRYTKYVSSDALMINVKIRLKRFWGGSKLIIPGPEVEAPIGPDNALVKAVARASLWNRKLVDGEIPSINAVAREEGLSSGYVRRLLPLAFLAPDIIDAILEGRQPQGLSLLRLTQGLPLLWTAQRQKLGFEI